MVLEAEAVDEVVDMIEKTLHTGSLSEGKIFILPVEEAVRVRGERGKQAPTERSTPLWADITRSASKELSRLSEPLP